MVAAPGASRVHFYRRADGPPTGVTDRHVAGVEPCVAQRDRGAAADVKAIGAVHYHRFLLGEFAHPLADAFGVTPGDTFGDVQLARDEVLRARVDELQRLAFRQHRSHFLDANS